MEFKAGDRVRVLRFNGEDVDFYGTLKYVDKCMANLFDCTIKRNEGLAVFLPSDNSFGEDKEDYFVLEEDEEDTKGGNNMPTIKRKVEMNLSQLIEWAQDNIEEATKKVYRVNENEVIGDHVRFTEVYSDLQVRLHGYIPFDTTFTVGVEEEITEDTRLDELVVRYRNDDIYIFPQERIDDFKNDSSIVAFYIPNDDLTMTLIWTKEKGLVE